MYLLDDRNYHGRKKFFRKYDKAYGPYNNVSNYDLRLIILRHAERIDTSLGHNWYDQVFGGAAQASTQNYLHRDLPRRLPKRSRTFLYIVDPPISRLGENSSCKKGKALSRLRTPIDCCYSSPASRCILTANAILHGMRQKHVPIRIEPLLFEPMYQNEPLELLGNLSPFMSSMDWKNTGYNIDRSYKRLAEFLNLFETMEDYRQRSSKFLRSIERHFDDAIPHLDHRYGHGRRSTILISGHQATAQILQDIAFRQPLNVQLFEQQTATVPYLNTVILARDVATHKWGFQTPMFAAEKSMIFI